jgi:hypothetical protein
MSDWCLQHLVAVHPLLPGVSEVFTNIGTMELFYTQGGLDAAAAAAAAHAGWTAA